MSYFFNSICNQIKFYNFQQHLYRMGGIQSWFFTEKAIQKSSNKTPTQLSHPEKSKLNQNRSNLNQVHSNRNANNNQQTVLKSKKASQSDMISEDEELEEEMNKINIKIERVYDQLDQKIDMFRQKQKKLENKIQNLKKQAKVFLQQDKKKQAKKLIQEMTRMNKHLETISLKKRVIQQQKATLEEQEMNKNTIQTCQSVNAVSKLMNTEDHLDKIQDMMLDMKDQKMIQEQLNDRLRACVNDQQNQQEAEDMMKELEAELNSKKKQNVVVKNKQIFANVKKSSENQIDRMMKELA